MAQNNQQLERRGGQALVDAPAPSTPVSGLITTVDDLSAQLNAALEKYHVITPVVSTSSLAAGYGAALSVVNIDLRDGSADVYKDNLMKADEVALTKISLMRLSAALGISWTGTRRLDTGARRFYWNVEVHGEYRAPDGTLQKINASREVDFTDGSAQIAGKSTAEVAQMRKHGQQLAETKAKLRAIRDFGVKPKYTRHDLRKPFLVCRFSFMPDMQNPEVAKLVTAAALGVTHLLYGQAPAAHDQADNTDLPPELGGRAAAKQISGTASPAATAPSRAEASFDDEPEVETDTRPRYAVESVLKQNDAGDWTIVLAGGAEHATRDKSIAKAASEAGKHGKAITLTAAIENGVSRVVEMQTLDEPAPTAGSADAGVDDGLRLVEKIETRRGESPDKKDPTKKKPWTLYTIVVSTGESFKTFSDSFAGVATEAKEKGWKVRLTSETNERYPDQQDLTGITLIDPRQGTLLGGEGEKY